MTTTSGFVGIGVLFKGIYFACLTFLDQRILGHGNDRVAKLKNTKSNVHISPMVLESGISFPT